MLSNRLSKGSNLNATEEKVALSLEFFAMTEGKQFPVVLVTGARQVGKTNFLLHLRKENRTYVTLDDPLLQTMAKEKPALFLQ
jgi:predicted AAA+ superfamily ATPase